MRGVDFYNIPTTLLSQVDSSIGGKTAIDFDGVKNIVGAFYQPKGVIIDPDLLKTLSKRQVSNGLAESVKMALTCDKELFELIENNEFSDDILEQIITRSIKIKKSIVEADEREGGLRKILNFGHTFGHGIESVSNGELYHGECVAIGMTVVCSAEVKERLISLLERIGLPSKFEGDTDGALNLIVHDKKNDKSKLSCIFVDKIGSYRIEKMSPTDFCDLVRKELQ
jgi:3-dehydroquinate synthase